MRACFVPSAVCTAELAFLGCHQLWHRSARKLQPHCPSVCLVTARGENLGDRAELLLPLRAQRHGRDCHCTGHHEQARAAGDSTGPGNPVRMGWILSRASLTALFFPGEPFRMQAFNVVLCTVTAVFTSGGVCMSLQYRDYLYSRW